MNVSKSKASRSSQGLASAAGATPYLFQAAGFLVVVRGEVVAVLIV